MEVRALGRVDAAPEEAHGGPAVPVQAVRASLQSVRPPGAAHEAPHVSLNLVVIITLSDFQK